jgi:hypothetical protein
MSKDDRSKFARKSLTGDGWSNEDEATVTCLCGAVQMVVVSLS